MWHDIWSLVLVIALWGWIISTLVFIFLAFPARGVFASRPAFKWGVCGLVSFMIWIFGLIKA